MPPKSAYQSPRLTEHGNAVRMTCGDTTVGTQDDGGPFKNGSETADERQETDNDTTTGL
jgi:hypothetical protein